jgi:photosystem II stability/assembly factor-like uncharacterized protein
MFHVTINPHDPNEVLLSCDMTGAYISHDGGHHWRMFDLRGSIHFFAFDPNRRGTLYAGTDVLWRSTNDGATWQLVWPRPETVSAIVMDSDHADETVVAKPNLIGSITSIAVDPADSKILYATAENQGRNEVVVSYDQGRTWRVLLHLSEGPSRLWLDPRSEEHERDIYVATAHGIQVRIHGEWRERSVPAGMTLSSLSLGFPATADVPSTAYGVTDGTQPELMVTKDGGRTWERSVLPGEGTKIRGVATSLSHPRIAYASYRGMQLDGETLQGVARTDDFGQHWQLVWRSTSNREDSNVHDAWIADAMTPAWTEEPLSLTVDDQNPDLAYVTDLGRTLATTDGGHVWTARYSKPLTDSGGAKQAWASTGLDVTTTYGYLFDPFDSKRRFILTTDIGLFRSEDGGHSWLRSVDGVPARWRNTTYSVVFDPTIPGKMWAAMSDIHDLPRPKMWRHRSTEEYIGGICVSEDGGRTWRSSSTGMPSTSPTSLVIDPSTPPGHRTLWAATMGHGIYRSRDDGRSWSPVNAGIAQKNALGWRLARSSNGVLYALIARRSEDGSIGNSGDGALYQSTDNAEHWTSIAPPKGANAPNGIAIDPEDSSRIYLALWARATPTLDLKQTKSKDNNQPERATHIFNGRYGGIAVSSDGGRTWRWTLERDRHIYDVTIDPDDPHTLYAAGFESTAWVSHDRGEHWTRIPGFNFKWGHRVQADPEDPGKVYISTFGGGVWHILLSGPAAQDITTSRLKP